jgi:DNA-binding NtrC family response regulator
MPESTALLVSCAPAVIEAVRGVSELVPRLRVEVCPRAEPACARARRDDVALVLAHLSPGGDAGVTRLLWAVAAARRPCATLVLSDSYDERQAHALLRAGAADYLVVPAELPKLTHLLDSLTRRLRPPAGGATPAGGPNPLAGLVPQGLEGLMEQVVRVAPQDTTLLLTGETGTGKTRLARLVHDLSPHRQEPFLIVDCGALSPSLVESELFGHAKGAFTGAQRDRAGKLAAAGAGTLLLDEVNSLPLPLQAKLLRAVDERVFEPVGADRSLPMRARLVAASNAPLEGEVAAGRFRADLYYRLNVVGFHLPPLRERRGSVAALARQFLAEYAGRNRPDVTCFSAPALRALEGYDWPGNVRELRNVVERAVALCPGPQVGPGDLPEPIRDGRVGPQRDRALTGNAPGVAPNTLHRTREMAERQRITEALRKHRNNRLRAAMELGISRQGLYKKLQKHGLMQAGGRVPPSEVRDDVG